MRYINNTKQLLSMISLQSDINTETLIEALEYRLAHPIYNGILPNIWKSEHNKFILCLVYRNTVEMGYSEIVDIIDMLRYYDCTDIEIFCTAYVIFRTPGLTVQMFRDAQFTAGFDLQYNSGLWYVLINNVNFACPVSEVREAVNRMVFHREELEHRRIFQETVVST